MTVKSSGSLAGWTAVFLAMILAFNSACPGPGQKQTLDTSSEGAFSRSLRVMSSNLNDDEKIAFQVFFFASINDGQHLPLPEDLDNDLKMLSALYPRIKTLELGGVGYHGMTTETITAEGKKRVMAAIKRRSEETGNEKSLKALYAQWEIVNKGNLDLDDLKKFHQLNLKLD